MQAWSGTVWFLMSVKPDFIALTPLLASFCRSVSHSLGFPPTTPLLHLSSLESWWRIRVARLIPGIPEQLFGSSASVVLRPGDERGNGKTFIFIFPSFQNSKKLLFPPTLCSFVFLIVSTQSALLTLTRRQREYSICLHYDLQIRVLLLPKWPQTVKATGIYFYS